MHSPVQTVAKIWYTAIAVLGVPVNLVAIVILSRGKCGLSSCTTCYLVAMAAADLLTIVTQVILRRINIYYFPLNFLRITPVCGVLYILRHAATDCSVWFTVTFTFGRFVAICWRKLKMKFCTRRGAVAVLAVTGTLLCLKNIPKYFALEPWAVISGVPWLCFLKDEYFSQPGWLTYDWVDAILTPLLPFVLVLLLNTLTVRHILAASRSRKMLKTRGKEPDREMESRKKSIVLLFTLSGSFIALWLVDVADSFYYSIAGISISDYNDFQYTFRYVGVMLLYLNCCTNTFIYVFTQSKFRAQLVDAVQYPAIFVIRVINKHRRNFSK